MKKKILFISGEFIPYTQSIGGVIRLISFIYSLKNYKIKIISLKKKKFGYFGFKKYISHSQIKYLNTKIKDKVSILHIFISIFKKIFSNFVYIFAIDHNFFNNQKYRIEIQETLKTFKPDYILITAPPFSLFKLVKNIRKINRKVKIILDYRDGWTQRIKSKKYSFLKRMFGKYERKIINQSDFILCATRQIYNDLKLLKGNKNILLLRNGYWNLSKNNFKKKKTNYISVGYFGLISDDSYGYRDVKIIFNALRKNKNIKFSFFGNSKIKNNNIKNYENFHFNKNISYFETQKKMKKFDYLLILHTEKSTSSEVITGKFYEYLSSKIPIIVISNGVTEAGKLVKYHNLGYSVDYSKQSLENFFKKLKKKEFLWRNLNNIKQFSRFNENKKLIKLLGK